MVQFLASVAIASHTVYPMNCICLPVTPDRHISSSNIALILSQNVNKQAVATADAVRVAFEFFSQRAALGFAIPEWLPTPDNIQYHSAVSRLDSAVYGIIADRRQRLQHQQTPATKGSQVRHKVSVAVTFCCCQDQITCNTTQLCLSRIQLCTASLQTGDSIYNMSRCRHHKAVRSDI